MLKTVSSIGRRAKAFIEHYATTVDGQIEGALKSKTGTPAQAHDIRLIATKCRDLAASARRLLNDPEASLLSADEREDLTAIAEEMELGAVEADTIGDPDAVWMRRSKQEKERITQREGIDQGDADRLRARIRGDLRKQKAPPTANSNGNNPA
jgi:hypothetical protein